MTYHLVTNSVAPSQVRETDDAYIIEDVPFVKPMQLSGGYVPEASIASTVEQWDGVPVTLQHPRNARGEPIAANRKPETHLGIVEEPYYDGEVARAGRVVLRKGRLEAVEGAEDVRDKLEANEAIDVSSQYAARDLPTGEYDGAMRENVEEITRPDSLAILPNQRGRCSIDDGCGIDPQLVANAEVSMPMTHNATHDGEDMDAAAAGAWDLTPISPDDVDEWTDSEWDGADAVAAMPNPSEEESAAEVLDQTHAAVPTDEDDRDAKGAWKLPFRTGADAPVNTRALVAIDAALSGARGGVDDLSGETQAAIGEWVESMLAAAPEDRFGSMAEDQTGNVLASIGRQVTEALGLTAASSESAETTPAESGVGADADEDPRGSSDPADEPGDTMENREKLIDEITSNSAITAESLDDACDDRVQKLHDDVVANDDGSTDNDDAVEQIANRLDSIEDQMVTQGELDDVVANTQTEQKEAELAREIVANSADYDEPESVREDYPTKAALETKREQVVGAGGMPAAGDGIAANLGEEPEFDVSPGTLGGEN